MSQKGQWIDITSQILNLPKSFKLLQVVRDEKFALQDGMHAHQINDNKIDPKHNLSQDDTIEYLIKNKQVKLPSELSIQQILTIVIEVFKHQALILKCYPMCNTIYTFTYLYDKSIFEKFKDKFNIIPSLVHSINVMGTYVYQLHKQSCSIKEDDLSIELFSFRKYEEGTINHQHLIKQLINIETSLNNQLKGEKNDKEKVFYYELLIMLIKFRKNVHNLAKSLGKYFDQKMSAKIQKDIQTVYNNITSIEQIYLANKEHIIWRNQNVLKNSNIFLSNISKTLRTHFGPRQIPSINYLEALFQIKASLQQFQLFIPIPTKLSILRDRIERLHDMPLNLWSKSYIKNNMFHKQEHIFNFIKTQDIIWNDMNDYLPMKQAWKSQEKFISLIKPTGPVASEVLFRYMGRKSRSFWQISKIYQDFNILVHLSNQFDGTIFPPGKKELFLSSWYYNFGLNIMVKQLFSGIQTDLYQHYQYPYVFYLLQNLLAVYDRNSQVFLKKFDAIYQKSFFEESLNHKKKKKVSQASRRYFSDAIFKKGLHYYVRSIHRILFVLVNRKLIDNPFQQNLQIRIKNRFRIFKNIYFVRTIDYQQYKHDYEVINQDQNGYLTEAMELLKEAKNLFQKIIGTQLDENDCNYKVKQDAQNLMKICVKCSLAVMSLKMNQNSKKFKIQNNNSKYPQITMY